MSGKFDPIETAWLDELPSPVYVKDGVGGFIYANKAMQELVSIDPSDTSKQTGSLDLASRMPAALRFDEVSQLDARGSEIVTTFKNIDGEEQIILARKKLIDLPDGSKGIICVLNDISMFALYEKELEEKHRELRRQQIRLKELASLDHLTGIYNRRAFYDYASEVICYANAGDLEVGVLMFDLDKFKNLNDTYGHAAGDDVLIQCVEIVKECIRSADIFARLGGEEFALLLPDTNVKSVQQIAERIRAKIAEKQVYFNGELVKFTTSIGGTMWEADEKNIDAALGRADDSLYQAKSDGRNAVCFLLKDELDAPKANNAA